MRDEGMAFKYKVMVLASIGFGLGVIIGTLVTAITATLEMGDGTLYICAPELTEAMGGVLKAFVVQAIVSGLLGTVGMGLSSVYYKEDWSVLKATSVHFPITLVFFYATAFFLRWWSYKDVAFCLVMFCIFFAEYIIIWLANYFAYKAQIARINKALNEMKRKDNVDGDLLSSRQ